MTADPKPGRRLRVNAREWSRLHDVKGGPCRLCGRWGYELHHLVGRDLGGDDVEQNLVPLCTGCHGRVQELKEPERSQLGRSLTPVERAYLLEKKGPLFARGYYGIKEET